MTEQKKPALNEQTAAVAKTIYNGLSIDKNTGTITPADNLYKNTLPEGLTMEVVEAVSNHNTTFVAAGAEAVGRLSVEAMAGTKVFDKTVGTIPMGKHEEVSYTTDRERVYPNPAAKGENIKKYGVVTTTYSTHAGTNGGQLKVARSIVSELAAEALSK